MDKIKILHIVTALSWRGGEQQVAYLLDELESHVDQYVLCSQDSMMEAHCMEEEVEHFTQKKRSGFDLAYAKRIKKLCDKYVIDLIHVHDAHAHTFAVLAADFYGNKTGIILSRRVDFPIKDKWSSKHKYNHKSIKRILCVSNAIKEITARGIQDKSKLVTVYSGIDLTKFSKSEGKFREELNVKDETFLIGNTSALADHKDYFTFLDVAEKVIAAQSNAHFAILGDGPMKDEIVNYSKTKNLQGRVQFLGFRSDVPSILSDLDCFLITSKTEGLGTSILDAFACEVPVVATKAGGIPELVENRKTGLLNEVKDVEALTISIIELASDSSLQKDLVEEASKKVQLFTKTATAQQTLTQYKMAIS